MTAAIRIRNRIAVATPIPRVAPSLWVVAELVLFVAESPFLFGIVVVVDMVAGVSVLVVVVVVGAGALVEGDVVPPLVEISEIINL